MIRRVTFVLVAALTLAAAALNFNFGRVSKDGTRVEYAPDSLWPNPARASDSELMAAGWVRIGIRPPSPATNQVVSAVTYAVRNDQVVAVYSYTNAAPPVVRYSKRKLSIALANRGLFARFDAWAQATEAVPGSGLTVARLLADSAFMKSDDIDFVTIRNVAEAMFGVETVRRLLEESEDHE